ncbi:GBF-interacting protein 1-like isoform X2 [Rhododendron vialii]|uniref:GBF-interacting protein 1-like isoform X2 n=1 Tax=Rhododendron vialii TaxID=182163 RepID=UPI00265EFA2F|nr:GBF-interacting protein 1-like isoform X2 [Rhododendron vialii]
MSSSSNSGGSRVLIPSSVRKTIHDIKEIAAKHSDEDIFLMLKECNMDPDETAQRLLYLDTFQEVKKKRDLKKPNVNSRISEESRWRMGTQGRGFRGGRGHYSSTIYHGAGGGRNASAPKENGVNNRVERGFNPLPTVPEKTEKNTNSRVTISSNISVSGPTSIPNGSSGHEHALHQSADEVSSQRIASKSGASCPAVNGSIAEHTIANSVQATLGDVTCVNTVLQESLIFEKNEPSEHSQSSPTTTSEVISVIDGQSSQLVGLSEVVASEAVALALEGGSESFPEQEVSVLKDAISKLDMNLEKLKISCHQAVIFPDHLQVPEDIKNGLTFGSLDFEQSLNSGNNPEDSNDSLPVPVPEFLLENDKAASETSLSNLNVSSSAREGDYLDNSHSLPHVPDSKAHLKDVSSGLAPIYDHSKQDIMFSQGGLQYPFVHMGPHYGFPFIQPVLGSQLVQYEGAETQSGNSTVSSTSATTQTATQPAGVGHSSIPLSPPPFPVFRQPYPPYYFPFGPYFPSFFVASNAQQLLGPGGSPQQTSTGNAFLSPPPPVPGTKFSVPQGKPGVSADNLPRFGVPSGYNSYSPSPAATSGNSTGSEEIAAPGLKENSVYSTVPQGEGPLLWLPAPGREILHANAFYNHLPPGQHAAFPPPPAGIYHPTQTMAATSTGHPHL